MPTATDELREKMLGYFGDSVDLYGPLQFLKESGWNDNAGTLLSPNRTIWDKEWDCVDFLCQEWDFSYFSGKSASNKGEVRCH